MGGRRVLIVDDVITAGTAIREALVIIPAPVAAGSRDRGRPGPPGDRRRCRGDRGPWFSAQAVAGEAGVPVRAVAGLADLLAFADGNEKLACIPRTPAGLPCPLWWRESPTG